MTPPATASLSHAVLTRSVSPARLIRDRASSCYSLKPSNHASRHSVSFPRPCPAGVSRSLESFDCFFDCFLGLGRQTTQPASHRQKEPERNPGKCVLPFSIRGFVGFYPSNCLVPMEGVEPTHSHEYQILSLARLPIPPHRPIDYPRPGRKPGVNAWLAVGTHVGADRSWAKRPHKPAFTPIQIHH
jgi:hypothetical protein